MLEEPILVYNFYVEDCECYYVSEQSVLVHNNNPCGNQQSVGKLEDGRKVIVRRNSTEGHPTLEIQSGKRRIKIRYDD